MIYIELYKTILLLTKKVCLYTQEVALRFTYKQLCLFYVTGIPGRTFKVSSLMCTFVGAYVKLTRYNQWLQPFYREGGPFYLDISVPVRNGLIWPMVPYIISSWLFVNVKSQNIYFLNFPMPTKLWVENDQIILVIHVVIHTIIIRPTSVTYIYYKRYLFFVFYHKATTKVSYNCNMKQANISTLIWVCEGKKIYT